MSDKFSKYVSTLDGPSDDGFPIVPSDETLFEQPTRSIWSGEGGTITVMMNTGKSDANTILSFTNVPAGTSLNIRVKKVFANTTANNLIGLY